MSTIAIVDYSMGNLRSVAKAFEHVVDDSTQVVVTSSADEIMGADRVVFPGQGAARDCMAELQNHGLVDVVRDAAANKPFLGICMGMQVLMEVSEEGGNIDCLGLYQGHVKAFRNVIDQSKERLTIPQMGWNQVWHAKEHPLWDGIESGSRFYFVHSYYIDPEDKTLAVGETDYGIRYASAIAKDNVFAIQAHPEKSADDGLKLLENFARWNGTV